MSDRLVAVFSPFENLTDPRIERTRRHELFDLVVVALCGTIAGADTWTDIERFGRERLDWLRTFLRLAGGIPSHDTFGRVFARLDPAGLVACIRQWLVEVGCQLGQHIAIDGKTLRGSFDTAAGRSPLHLVSAWASETRLTLGQVAVDAKSNEITAIPLLLDGCQKEIAQQIIDQPVSNPTTSSLCSFHWTTRTYLRGLQAIIGQSWKAERCRSKYGRKLGDRTPFAYRFGWPASGGISGS
jgi:DDE_Tnp_1-associated